MIFRMGVRINYELLADVLADVDLGVRIFHSGAVPDHSVLMH